MPGDTIHIEEAAVQLEDIVTFHSQADSALMHIDTSTVMELHSIATTPLGEHTGWIFTICVIVCLLIGLSRFMSGSYIPQIFGYLMVPSKSRGGVYTDLFLHYFPVSVLFSVCYILVESLIILEALVVFGYYPTAAFGDYMLTLALVASYTIVKLLLHVSITSGFGLGVIRENILKHRVLASSMEVLMQLVIAMILPFLGVYNAKVILILSLIVLSFLSIWRLVRLFEDISLNLLSFVNILLYLCALEIAPLACIVKALGVI